MRLIESLKKKKFILFNIFLTLYIGINLIGGERGLISYFDKNINHEVSFELDKAKKTSLLEGLDDIGLTLAKVNHISDFENKQESKTPWLYSQQIK